MSVSVSVVVPCYNERRWIGAMLEAVRRQTYPLDRLEVVIADGGSSDGTREVVETYAREHPELRVVLVDNPARSIPAALNRAIAAAQGRFVVRLDAHSAPAADYVERCLETLERTGAANVGGVWEIEASGPGWLPRSIAAAAAHPFGAGDARYRISGRAGAVDTVPFGAFRREWLERAGAFNEALLTNEDYEFNVRLRLAGGVVWFDPAIRSIYVARGGLRELARQYARYGYWKAQMLRRYPCSLRWRQAVPPLFVLATLVLGVAAIRAPLARSLLAVQWGAYLILTLAAGAFEAWRRRDLGLLPGLPLAFWTMHLTWGGAFLWGAAHGEAAAENNNHRRDTESTGKEHS